MCGEGSRGPPPRRAHRSADAPPPRARGPAGPRTGTPRRGRIAVGRPPPLVIPRLPGNGGGTGVTSVTHVGRGRTPHSDVGPGRSGGPGSNRTRASARRPVRGGRHGGQGRPPGGPGQGTGGRRGRPDPQRRAGRP